MENTIPRVLAYTFAKELTNDDLSNVAGGGGQHNWSSRPSGYVSGTNGNWDSSIDIVIDG